eukprot:CAMPEP_0177707486 /NCGR_PEP_ID=MMETSP0484_2-20121128/9776_1 /TAXON_ID=354590 /ORGANISM="Rhodomonas lens, Strain RHODO" /LENGTH=294 /DNA_ID=CAMNT_0019219001 /DNA_START=194 /DNA_END=1074 /DNA_ORIENTATION=+
MTVPGQQPATVENTPISALQAADILKQLGLVSLTFSPNTAWSDAKSEELKNALAKDTSVPAQNIMVLQFTKATSTAQVVFHSNSWTDVCAKLENAVMNATSGTSSTGVVACSGGTKDAIGKGAGASREPAKTDTENVGKENEELKRQVAALKSQLAEASKDKGGGGEATATEDEKLEKIAELEEQVSDLKYDLAAAKKASDEYVQVLQKELHDQTEALQDKLDDAISDKDGVEFELAQAKKASEEYLALIQEEAEEAKEQREEKVWELSEAKKAAERYVGELEKEVAELKAKLA